jgi:cytochrome c5
MLVAFFFGTLGVSACGFPPAGAVPGPVSAADVTKAQSKWPDATADSLEQGRQLFSSRCTKCHSLPDRGARSDERWPKILDVMGPRADLSPDQTKLVLRFVLATRTEPAR